MYLPMLRYLHYKFVHIRPRSDKTCQDIHASATKILVLQIYHWKRLPILIALSLVVVKVFNVYLGRCNSQISSLNIFHALTAICLTIKLTKIYVALTTLYTITRMYLAEDPIEVLKLLYCAYICMYKTNISSD